MRTITRRLEQLEEILAPTVEKDEQWGSMAGFRDLLLRHAQEQGQPFVAELKEQLDWMGPIGLCREVVRDYLAGHGYEQEPKESLAETTARALGIDMQELRFCIQEGRLGRDLVTRFPHAE